ncbi:AEC family transporter [Falsiroseomonas bella]|uniref:AEC family transporter n=1 Tax=Falsiroseomonas bella TaxID=2184016 RepID=A0A317FHK9_9PROT|nr:AEC family transporter [Falsiroseomonas bella]PWS38571.1 AEC family transporter [Falsiroseomonas bella]
MTLAPWADAFVPVFGLLALGALLKRRLLRDDAVWAGIERLVFWVLLPCLIAGALSAVRFDTLPVGGMAVALWAALSAGTALAVALSRLLGHGHAAMTSVLQGGIRFNNLMGFAIGGAIWGAEGIAYAAVATGIIVPFVQAVATIAFVAGRGSVRVLPLLRQVLLNPLILGCLAGFAIGLVGGLPPGLQPAVRNLGNASIALGLLCVGAALTLQGLGDRPATQAATALLKLLVMPLMTWAFCAALGLGPLATAIAVLFMALPTAATSYVMARAMGGDAKLMAAITTSEHLLSVLTLPVWVWLLTR